MRNMTSRNNVKVFGSNAEYTAAVGLTNARVPRAYDNLKTALISVGS